MSHSLLGEYRPGPDMLQLKAWAETRNLKKRHLVWWTMEQEIEYYYGRLAQLQGGHI